LQYFFAFLKLPFPTFELFLNEPTDIFFIYASRLMLALNYEDCFCVMFKGKIEKLGFIF